MNKQENRSTPNTNPTFFKSWSKEQLEIECARLNRVLKDYHDIIEEMPLFKGTREQLGDIKLEVKKNNKPNE